VKSQVFLTDLGDFYYFDQVWKEFFPSPPPRTTVQVSGLLVPGCRVEIDLIAVRPSVTRRVITGAETPTPMAHYCQGILAGKTMYAAGQIASDYRTGVPTGSDLRNQTRYVLNNIRGVLRAAGCDLKDVVKSQVFVTDLNDFLSFDEAWKEFFPSPPPRTTVQVSALLVPGCRIEIDLTAVLPGVARRGMDSEAVLAGETLHLPRRGGVVAHDGPSRFREPPKHCNGNMLTLLLVSGEVIHGLPRSGAEPGNVEVRADSARRASVDESRWDLANSTVTPR
jgi:reactive intermediate/imine deaminase